ncbi:MAG: hypothetical protein LBJ14_09520 [Desulfarculales bacterium]|jgi:hypothetical protein|nr:hypothetical protein [Desulfarculales bacterium]
MKPAVCLTALALIFCVNATPLYGQCTEDEMLAKARTVQQKFESLERNNYNEYMRLLLRFNNKAQMLNEKDADGWCDLYDQMLLEM